MNWNNEKMLDDAVQPRCLSQKEAARYLGIGRTLFARIGPAAIRLGRRRVYDRIDLDRWLDDYKSRGRVIKEDLWPEKKDSTKKRFTLLVDQDGPRGRTPSMSKHSA
jgi:hypothetical protein